MQGLVPFPHAATTDAVIEAVDFAVDNSDLLVWHEINGGTAAEYAAWRYRPTGKPVYLALAMVHGRDHLAWARYMVDLFQPAYLNYAIEANDLAPDLQEQLPAIYAALKAELEIPVFVSLQATMGWDPADLWLMEHSDYLALSVYEYLSDNSFVAPLTGKPTVIAETAYPAEPLTYPMMVYADEHEQARYLKRVLSMPFEFVVWFLPRDYDDMWRDFLEPAGADPWHLVWKDTGLLDGEGNPRKSMKVWGQMRKRRMR
jgi:hypothetical protein